MESTELTIVARGQTLFQCRSCSRSYKRQDHLERHARSHSQERPYRCHICLKTFRRNDLLKRHVAAHGLDVNGTSRHLRNRSVRDLQHRVLRACRTCSVNHLRCTEEKPCRRCVEKGVECTWNAPDQTITVPLSNNGSLAQPYSTASYDNSYSSSQSVENTSPMSCTMDFEQHLQDNHTLPPPIAGTSTTIYDNQSFDLPTDIDLMQLQWSLGSELFDLGINPDLNDEDSRFLVAYNANVPFEMQNNDRQNQHAGQSGESSSASQCVHQETEISKQAFWIFRPSSHDNSVQEQLNLSLPEVSPENSPHELRISLGKRTTCAKLGTAARDKIVALIVKSCRQDNLSRAVASFPTETLLDTLLQYYLTSPVTQANLFIHVATFDPNQKRPELLAAMVACGAVLTADPTLTKLGFAIQECVRVAIPMMWETDNTLVRDLELSQAFLITIETGLWSGYSRRVEIAESFLQCVLTMLRRDGRLRQSGYPGLSLPMNTDDKTLRSIWETWAHNESLKRLAFRILQHDTNVSMALLVNPLISYAEMTVAIPDSAKLWFASTPRDWQALSESGANRQRTNVIDFLDDPESFYANSGALDLAIAQFAFLSCVWRLVWEYIQLASLQRTNPRRWSTSLTNSRQEELSKLLRHFRFCTEAHLPYDASLMMRLEHTSLHIHMPLVEIHRFVGMEGSAQAREAGPVIFEWVKSEAGRRAVHHAARIVHAGKEIPKTMIQGPTSVMLYHAGLALWLYGWVSKTNIDLNMSSTSSGRSQDVWLEETESAALERFTQLGHGAPFIRGAKVANHPAAFIYLSESDKVLKAVVEILRSNHEGMPIPRLVDRLTHLMVVIEQALDKDMIWSG